MVIQKEISQKKALSVIWNQDLIPAANRKPAFNYYKSQQNFGFYLLFII